MSRSYLLSGAAAVACIVAASAPACAQSVREFRIPPGPMSEALTAFGRQSGHQIFFTSDTVAGLRSPGVSGRLETGAALDRLLAGSGLTWTQSRPGVFAVQRVGMASVDEAVEIDEVIVTGTLLRSSGDLASPVVVVDRDAIDQRGYGNVANALNDLPQNYAGSATPVVQLSGANRGGSNSVYATGVNLRGLGPSATLVLVNGRRLAGTGSRAEFADISTLPTGAVDRVDVLLDGASALYGADAVAGVVNVVMKREFDGHETRVRLAAARGGAEDISLSHLAGTTWSGGAAYASVEYQTSNALNAYDRAYTRTGDLRPFGGTDWRGLNSAPGNILGFNAAAGAYASLFAIRPNASGTAQTSADFIAGDANLQFLSAGTDLLPAVERLSAYARVRQTVGERLVLTGDIRFNNRDYEIAGLANSGIFTVTRANPYFVSPTGAASHTIGYSFLRELGPIRQTGSSESLGVTTGFDYAIGDGWSVEGYLTYAQERADIRSDNRVNSRFVNEALGSLPDDPATSFSVRADGYLNLFGAGTANSRTVLDFISSGYSRGHDFSRAQSANLLLQGPLASLPGGNLQIALGAQFRSESLEGRSSFLGSTATPTNTVRPRRERDIAAVFAELRVPLVGDHNARPGLHSLELSLAGRYEEYDDFGTTTNPKVGVVWSPIPDVKLRASWGTSFRAASLPQVFDGPGASATFLNRADGTRTLTLLLTGGNPDLRPETSETFTAGISHRPEGGFDVDLNYFETRFEDRIALPVTENIVGALSDPDLSSFVTLINPGANPTDLAIIESYATFPWFPALYPTNTYGAIVDSRWLNTGAVRVRGVDLTLRRPIDLGEHLLAFDGTASYVFDYESRLTPTAADRHVMGLTGYPVRVRARAGATWGWRDVSTSLHWSYVDNYADRAGRSISDWNTFDASATWRPSDGPFSDTSLTFSIQNILDADPPFYDVPSGFGFDPGQGSLLGRQVALQLTRRW